MARAPHLAPVRSSRNLRLYTANSDPLVAAQLGRGERLPAPRALQNLKRLVEQFGARTGIGRFPDVPERAIVERAMADAAVWVPYTDPGLPLARTIAPLRDAHTARTGTRPPSVTLLQSHGVVVAGDSAETIRRTVAMGRGGFGRR